MLRKFSAVALIGLLVCAGGGCTVVSRFQRQQSALAIDSTAVSDSLPVDPWALGPDIFESPAPEHEQVVPPVAADTLVFEQTAEDTVKPLTIEPAVAPPPSTKRVPLFAVGESRELPTSEPLPETPEPLSTYFTVQVGTFVDKTKAQSLATRASNALGLPGYIQFDSPFYRLRFGELATREQADSLHRVAMSRGFYDARVVKIDRE